ncbi:efflux RND transporter periplasmic adaptor subunit [Adhaeribacter aquaticus]|uniref:efflux RND transporter periplasmic adaptor subunit n=1 Tax=Adhaeribacter aquaticus TaxID=299567 RepID=UPI00047B81CD|nr:efflux RND transporter periplasmic adaptor subunit [Adhaeribacter aquaticus]
MKKQLSIALLIALVSFSACNKEGGNKEEQLTNLKKEQADIQDKIAKLEEELKAEGKGVAQTATPVSVVSVQPQAFDHYLEVQGRVDFEQSVAVSPRMAGVLTSVRVTRGDRVRKGQVLAVIDPSIMEQTIQELRTNLELTNTIYEKQKRLWDQKIGTEVQYLTAKNNKDALERKLATLRQQLDQYYIKAPISGVVDDFIPKVGEAVSPASPQPIGRIVNQDGIKVVAEVSEAYAGKVKAGDQAKIFLPDTNTELDATVKVVSQVINANSRSFPIELVIKNKANNQVPLRPNMIAVVRIKDYQKEEATVVPVNLVQKDENSTFVYVAEPNGKDYVVRKKPVTTGMTYKGKIEIVNGLASNDKVITVGYQSLNEGQTITF